MADGNGRNLYLEALVNQYNLIGLVFFVLASIIAQSAYPLLVGLGLELFYLALLPETEFFKRSVEKKYQELEQIEQARSLKERLEMLNPVQRRRYHQIVALVEDTQRNLRDKPESVSGLEDKLDTLQDRYLWLMELLNVYEHYLGSVRPDEVTGAMRDVEKQIQFSEGRVRKSLEDRLDVLKKRQARLDRVRENHSIVRTQVMTLEDVLRLIHESSMTMHNPQSIGRQLDDLLIDVEATEEAVHELNSFGGDVEFTSEDQLAQFDRELEKSLKQVEHEVHVRR